MGPLSIQGLKQIRVAPGEYCISDEDVVLTTLLGSCVSACLFDPVRRIVGMNHFLLSHKQYTRRTPFFATEAGRYGIHSMELVINGMMKRGARRENLLAKAFGGASLIRADGTDDLVGVGNMNVRFIQEFLASEKIPLVNADLGEDHGRVIFFYSRDFTVFVRKIRKIVNTALVRREKSFWSESLERRDLMHLDPDIWQDGEK